MTAGLPMWLVNCYPDGIYLITPSTMEVELSEDVAFGLGLGGRLGGRLGRRYWLRASDAVQALQRAVALLGARTEANRDQLREVPPRDVLADESIDHRKGSA